MKTELSFDVYEDNNELSIEGYVYTEDGEEKEFSYTTDPKDLFEAMKELKEEFGDDYDVTFRVQ